MNDIMDIRAAEMAELRRALREAKKQLAAARDNDAIVGALHKLALLLISGEKPGAKWRAQAEKTLARALPKISRCRIVFAAEMDAATLRRAAKLPAGGAAKLMDESYAAAGFLSAYSVPLKKGAGVCGLLLLYARGKNAFPAGMASDFALRLAQLLAAAITR